MCQTFYGMIGAFPGVQCFFKSLKNNAIMFMLNSVILSTCYL